MKLYSEDIEIIKELFDKKKVKIYFFHKKYQLSPAQLARTIIKLKKKEVIEINGDEVYLTPHGINWVIRNRKNIFLINRVKYWKVIPEELKQNSININELYNPDRKKIDKELYVNIEGGK